MQKGITVAGNLLVDKIKFIDTYPSEGMLTNIKSESMAVGGCVPNTGGDIAIIDKNVPVFAIGKVGKDDAGKFLLDFLTKVGINVDGVIRSDLPTSYTDVFTSLQNKQRTFFHASAANAEFCIDDVDVENLNCDIFHIGYALLLACFDASDEEYGTKLARLLAKVQKKGIKTSIDVVSEAGDRFKRIVTPSLKYCNYAIMNEVESGAVADVNPRNADGTLSEDAVKQILKRLFDFGVFEVAIIHCPEGGFAMTKDGKYYSCPSCDVPKGYIKGTVGAGDAFCAGALYALYKEKSIDEVLDIANLAAAANLSEADSISGMRSYEELLKLKIELNRR